MYALPDYHGHYHLYFDAYHHLWLISSSGVLCVNLSVERYVSSIDSVLASFGAKSHIDDMFVDNDGEVWLCQDGFISCMKYNWKRHLQKGLNLQDLEVTDGQLLLFYGNGQLECCDVRSGRKLYQNYAYSPEDGATY